MSDPHIVGRTETLLGGIDTTAYLRDAVAHVNRMVPAPDLVLLSGDLVNDGETEQYEHLAELLAPLSAPLHLMPGNHDRTDHLRAAFPDLVHDRDGRADGVIEGPLRIVTLDSSRFPDPGGTLDAEPARRGSTRSCVEAPRRADGGGPPPPAVRDRHQAHGRHGPVGRGDRGARRGDRPPPAGRAGAVRPPPPLHHPPVRGHPRHDRPEHGPLPPARPRPTDPRPGTTSLRRCWSIGGTPTTASSPTSRSSATTVPSPSGAERLTDGSGRRRVRPWNAPHSAPPGSRSAATASGR